MEFDRSGAVLEGQDETGKMLDNDVESPRINTNML